MFFFLKCSNIFKTILLFKTLIHATRNPTNSCVSMIACHVRSNITHDLMLDTARSFFVRSEREVDGDT